MEEKRGRDLFLPASIIIAAVLIAGSVIYSSGKKSEAPADGSPEVENDAGAVVRQPRPIDESDHIRGDKNARLIVVEYSDFECPFCKMFHETMKQAQEFYGADTLAWAYRQLPIASLHSRAEKESEASECAAELGGNDAFWAYADRIFELTPSNDGLDPALLPKIAEEVGLDKEKFELCLASGRHQNRIREDIKDAASIGARGTPNSVIVNQKGEALEVIPGVLPFISDMPGREGLKDFIDRALARL